MTSQAARSFPLWSRDETILVLWLAVRLVGQRITADGPEVVELSSLMRSALPESICDPRLRNAHGVARKIWAFMDRYEGRSARPLSGMAEAIWLEFAEAPPESLANAAAKARQSLLMYRASPHSTPSRGPVPHVGSSTVTHTDGAALVYVAVLEGTRDPENRRLVKIGFSSDIHRRADQLNFGFPPPLGLNWRIIATWTFPTAILAYRTEQAILVAEAATGRSCGKEFLVIEAGGLSALIQRCERRSIFSAVEGSLADVLASSSRPTFCSVIDCSAESPSPPAEHSCAPTFVGPMPMMPPNTISASRQ